MQKLLITVLALLAFSCEGQMAVRGPMQGFTPSLNLDFRAGVMPAGLTFTRGSIGTRFNSSGVMETIAANNPRVDYDPVTLACKGLLIEESRANLLLNSATLSTQNATVTAVAYTLSFYGTGSIARSGTSTGTLSGTSATGRVSVTFIPTAGTLTLTVTGTVSNAQLEAGGFVTSYIPTSGASVTRAADVCSMSLGSWYNAGEGALSVEYSPATVSSYRQIAQIDAGSTSNRISLAMSTGPARLDVTAGGTGSISMLLATPNAVANSANKAAVTWKVNDTPSIVAKGGSVNQSATTIPSVPTVTTLWLGTRGNNDVYLCGHIRQVVYYPRRVPNSFLQFIAQ